MSISSTLANLDAHLSVSLHLTVPYSPGCLSLYVSRISLAAKNCLTAHASTNSGATIIQNISRSRFHRAFHLFSGGTFGWTEVQAQMMVVETQLQIILHNVRFKCNCDVKSCGLLTSISTTSTAYGDQKNKIDEHFFRGI